MVHCWQNVFKLSERDTICSLQMSHQVATSWQFECWWQNCWEDYFFMEPSYFSFQSFSLCCYLLTSLDAYMMLYSSHHKLKDTKARHLVKDLWGDYECVCVCVCVCVWCMTVIHFWVNVLLKQGLSSIYNCCHN